MLNFGSDLLKIPKFDFLAFVPNFGHLDSEKSCKMFFFFCWKEAKSQLKISTWKIRQGAKSQFVNLMKESVLMVERKNEYPTSCLISKGVLGLESSTLRESPSLWDSLAPWEAATTFTNIFSLHALPQYCQ